MLQSSRDALEARLAGQSVELTAVDFAGSGAFWVITLIVALVMVIAVHVVMTFQSDTEKRAQWWRAVGACGLTVGIVWCAVALLGRFSSQSATLSFALAAATCGLAFVLSLKEVYDISMSRAITSAFYVLGVLVAGGALLAVIHR